MMIVKTCPNCKKQFKTDNKQKIYCTPKCTCASYQKKAKGTRKEANLEFFDWRYWRNGVIQ